MHFDRLFTMSSRRGHRVVVYLSWVDVYRNANRRVPFEAVLTSHQLTTVFFLNYQLDADRH
jgi:hypothetical protein